MNTFINILIIVGIISAIALIFLSVVSFIYIIRYNKRRNEKKDNVINLNQLIDSYLKQINSTKDGAIIASVFLCLVSLPYGFIHILTNKGEKYCDSVQTEDYCDSLSSDIISKINSVEGKYE